ncbi:MAG: hypothetical protein ABGZ53_06085 [Fuerstiella sp.]
MATSSMCSIPDNQSIADPLVLEIVQDNIAARLADAAVTADALWGWHEPGELLLAVQKDNVTIATHAF